MYPTLQYVVKVTTQRTQNLYKSISFIYCMYEDKVVMVKQSIIHREISVTKDPVTCTEFSFSPCYKVLVPTQVVSVILTDEAPAQADIRQRYDGKI